MMTIRYLIGFAMGLLTFIFINLVAAHLSSDCGLFAVFGSDSCSDDIARAGWPIRFYEEGGFAYRRVFDGGALSLDLGLGLASAGLIGWLFWRISKGK